MSTTTAFKVFDNEYTAALAYISAASMLPLIEEGKLELTLVSLWGDLKRSKVYPLLQSLPVHLEEREGGVIPPEVYQAVGYCYYLSPTCLMKTALLAEGRWRIAFDTDVFYVPPPPGGTPLPFPPPVEGQVQVVPQDVWGLPGDPFLFPLPTPNYNSGVMVCNDPAVFHRATRVLLQRIQEFPSLFAFFPYADQTFLNRFYITDQTDVRALPALYNYLFPFHHASPLWLREAVSTNGAFIHLPGMPKLTPNARDFLTARAGPAFREALATVDDLLTDGEEVRVKLLKGVTLPYRCRSAIPLEYLPPTVRTGWGKTHGEG